MGWYSEAIFDKNALMGLPFFLSQDITQMFQERALEEITPNIIEHLRIRYSGNFLRRRENQFSFELQDDELAVLLNGRTLSRLTSGPHLKLERAAIGLEDINESLEALLDKVKNPSQTWALEQFDIARTAFSRGQYSDALSYANNAIDGTENETGYRLDHRFHYLKGLVLFGDMSRKTGILVNYQSAQSAFEDAARYAVKADDKSESFCKAGLAACAAGQHENAFSLIEQACNSNPDDALAHYLFACLNFQTGDKTKGREILRQAFVLDLDIVTIALNDPSSINFEEDLLRVIQQVRNIHMEAARPAITTAKVSWSKALSRVQSEDNYQSLFPNTAELVKDVKSEIEALNLSDNSIFETAILATYFKRDNQILIDKVLYALGIDKKELADDLDEFKSEKRSILDIKPPYIRSFGRVYNQVWKDSNTVTSIGMLLVIIGVFIFTLYTMNTDTLNDIDSWTVYIPVLIFIIILAGFLTCIFCLIAVPCWLILRAVWIFFKSLLVSVFTVGRDKIALEKFEAEQDNRLKNVNSEISKVEADIKDAKKLRKDLMKILRS